VEQAGPCFSEGNSKAIHYSNANANANANANVNANVNANADPDPDPDPDPNYNGRNCASGKRYICVHRRLWWNPFKVRTKF
jgi:hypothetical protein